MRFSNSFPNDVAVIELRKELEFNENVQPIQYSPEEVPDGEEVVFLGWGKIRVRNTIFRSLIL